MVQKYPEKAFSQLAALLGCRSFGRSVCHRNKVWSRTWLLDPTATDPSCLLVELLVNPRKYIRALARQTADKTIDALGDVLLLRRQGFPTFRRRQPKRRDVDFEVVLPIELVHELGRAIGRLASGIHGVGARVRPRRRHTVGG